MIWFCCVPYGHLFSPLLPRMKKPIRKRRPTDLLGRVRHHFGLGQAELARLLGIQQAQVARAETSHQPLPTDAFYRLRMLGRVLPPPDAPEPPPPPLDPAPLQARHFICLDQARRLRYRLTHELPARARPAQNRLAAAAAIPAALAAAAADAPLPPRKLEDRLIELALLHNAALNELEDRSGPVPVALLQARRAGLLAEAAALAELLAAAGAPVDEAGS